MASVWVVQKGSYSDRRIIGIFSSEEAARDYLGDALPDDRMEYDVEGWKLDALKEERLVKVYHAFVEADGTAGPEDRYSYDYMVVSPDWCDSSHPKSYPNGYTTSACGKSTRSFEHAMKLAVEARQAWLRERAVGLGSPES